MAVWHDYKRNVCKASLLRQVERRLSTDKVPRKHFAFQTLLHRTVAGMEVEIHPILDSTQCSLGNGGFRPQTRYHARH